MGKNKRSRELPVVIRNDRPPQPVAPVAAVMDVERLAAEKQSLEAVISSVEAARDGTPAIVYWLGPMARISEAVVLPLYDQLRKIGRQQRLDLVLFTLGGDTEIPSRIVALAREYCETFSILVPHRAHSAGTLLALGADEIVMTPLSILGPIDPTRTHPLLPRREGAQEAEPISVQDMRHAMQFIREAGGAGTGYSPEAMATIFSALFEKIHPLAIGAIEQSYALSKLVAKRCLESHMDAAAERTRIDEIVDRLCDEYKSHQYEISRGEAKAIGLKVTDASDTLESALNELMKFYLMRNSMPPQAPALGTEYAAYIGWLDSRALSFRVRAQYRHEAAGEKYLGDEWTTY